MEYCGSIWEIHGNSQKISDGAIGIIRAVFCSAVFTWDELKSIYLSAAISMSGWVWVNGQNLACFFTIIGEVHKK